MKNGKTSEKNFSTYEEKRPRTPLGPYKNSGRGDTCQIRLPEAFRGYIRSYLLEELVLMPLYTLYKMSEQFNEYKEWKVASKKLSFIQESDAYRLWFFFKTDYWLSIINDEEKIKGFVL